MTRSEKFVYDLSKAACLSLWTYPNPILKDSQKELCDVLVVCQPDVLIFSVKEIELKEDGDREVLINRWKRTAIDESVKQIHGAQRRIAGIEEVTTAERAAGVKLGPVDQRQLHRMVVAIGAGGSVALESKDFGNGFVHVFDEDTVLLLLSELDTITDFTQYLTARANLVGRDLKANLIASEADLLATYLLNGRSFDKLLESKADLITLDNVWDDFSQSEMYAKQKDADQTSYTWDKLITVFHEDHLHDNMEFGGDLDTVDRTTRVMAREPRYHRRALAEAFTDFMKHKTPARQVLTETGTSYVFLKRPRSEPRADRVMELRARCYIARDDLDKRGLSGVVLGLATEVHEKGSGFSLDCALYDAPTWTDEMRAATQKIRDESGWATSVAVSHKRIEEFPS